MSTFSRTNRSMTIEDVAKLAGVSRQTVSRVLNNKGEISLDTRRRILGIIEEVGYEPNRTAQSLSRGRTNLIGLILPDITNPFYPEVASNLELHARALGYRILFCNTRDDPEEEIKSLRLLRQQRVDGLILCGSRLPRERLQPVVQSFRACVLVNSRAEGPNTASFFIDFAQGSREAVEHLIDLGRRRIGMLAPVRSSLSATEKSRGYMEALAAAGIALQPDLVVTAAPTPGGGMEGMHRLLAGRPDALFSHSDILAMGAIYACEQAGLRVPEDVAVAGFGDHPYAFAVRPALTTVSVPLAELGELAARTAVSLIQDEPRTRPEVLLPSRLLVRDSSGGHLSGSVPDQIPGVAAKRAVRRGGEI